MNFAVPKLYHPATLRLLRCQSVARLKRIAGSFRNPRRQVLSLVAICLGFIWISQAAASIMLRESANPDQLMTWIPLGLFVYSAWHFVKIVSRQPVEPFEWTPAETELLLSAPITRTQLITYRMASILSAAFIKAVCFSIVMIPDLSFWLAGLMGMFLGLILVDLVRVGVELAFHGLSRTGQRRCRIVVVGLVASVTGWGLYKCLTAPEALDDVASPGALIFLQSFVGELIGLFSTSIATILLLPFRPFCELMLVEQFSYAMAAWTGVSVLIVVVAALMVYRLDRWTLVRLQQKERVNYQTGLVNRHSNLPSAGEAKQRVLVPWRWAGLGSLAWRQLLGAYHYRMTLAVSLGVPTVLCCIPLLANHEPFMMLLNIVGGLVFYSFLLLPAALMLDFRRDVNRMSVLKSMPIGPVATTLGQLAAPVLVCSAFQWGVLAIATFSGSVFGWQALVAALLLIPVNTLIFAIENYIFLLSPYRRNQEGLDVFLRTILTFTAKGILFALGLAITIAWAFAAKTIGAAFGSSSAGALVFVCGAWLLVFALAVGFVWRIVRLYDRFDPSLDAPAIS